MKLVATCDPFNVPAIERATQDDFAVITGSLERYWPLAGAAPLHHVMFIHQFGDLALVVRDEQGVAAYLFGLIGTVDGAGYVHIVGVRDDQRRRGLGAALWAEFRQLAAARGVTVVTAITSASNERSIAFHRSLGMSADWNPDYKGPGEGRWVFRAAID